MTIERGTWVKFTADARLRKLTDDGLREQMSMGEGALIGEDLEAVVVQPISTGPNQPEIGYTVFFPEKNLFGWVYNYELYVQDPLRPKHQLNVHVVKK